MRSNFSRRDSQEFTYNMMTWSDVIFFFFLYCLQHFSLYMLGIKELNNYWFLKLNPRIFPKFKFLTLFILYDLTNIIYVSEPFIENYLSVMSLKIWMLVKIWHSWEPMPTFQWVKCIRMWYVSVDCFSRRLKMKC